MTNYYHLAREGVMGLVRQNDQLIAGAARQARTVREQAARISELEAALVRAEYQTELVKAQGRKTRSKVRGLKKALSDSRNHLGQALSRAEQAEARLGKRDPFEVEFERAVFRAFCRGAGL